MMRTLLAATILIASVAPPILSAHAGMWKLLEPELKRYERCQKNPSADECQPISGAELLAHCDSGDEIERAYCSGVLDAIADRARKTLPEWRCVPPTALRHPEQLRLMFVQEAHRIPQVLHFPAEKLVYYVVAKTFPCPNPLKTPPKSSQGPDDWIAPSEESPQP